MTDTNTLQSEFNNCTVYSPTVAQWLRHWATNRTVVGSIPHGVIGIFHWYNPSGCTMTLGSTQPITEMSTRNISWGKGGQCVRLTTLPPSSADCLKSWAPQPLGLSRPVMGMLYLLLCIVLLGKGQWYTYMQYGMCWQTVSCASHLHTVNYLLFLCTKYISNVL
jgi:hypothetical protein